MMIMGVPTAALAALLALTLSIPDTARGAENQEPRVVCYYTNWSVYRPGTAKFSPQNINPYLCTHLIYAFGGFTKDNSLKPFDKYQDIEKGGYAKFTGLKTYNKKLKTMLAIGGWNEGSSRFSPMVASAERRKELIKNSIKFLRQNHFDGLDLDWEYPSFRDGGKPRDRDNYAQLVQELREEFDRESQKTGRPRLILTMAVPAGLEYIDKGYDIPKLNKYLDWMNILSYDYHSAFEPAVNHHSPLYSLDESEDDEYNYDVDLNIDATIKYYLKAGADRYKLVLGIPTYGRSYTLFNPDANEIGAPADGPGDMGDATRENGYLAYYEICEAVKKEGWIVVQPNPRAMGPYAHKGNQWVGYDDEQIARRKSQYVAQMGLGGIMFWAIDNDDFRGECHGKPYPLIEAAKEALLNAPTDNLIVSVPAKRTRVQTNRYKPVERDTTTRSTIVRNSGGRQGATEEDTTKSNRGRKRIRTGGNTNKNTEIQRTRSGTRRRTKTTTVATTPSTTSTSAVTPKYTTPEPPTTPDPGSDFKCEDEGFFPHPRDCKKYFWCLSSGPSALGIIPHQFTCPSGLYFNKAADSCDYTQNVLCNKKLKKVTAATTAAPTTSVSTTTTTEAPTYSTSRKPPRITAATSRTTYLYTSTTTETPEYEDEYEYEDEEEDEDDRQKQFEQDAEEDPRVIKELIDLIKKVGGIEQLERHLHLQEDGTATVKNNDFTTPATISRSLYEKVLSQSAGTSNPLYATLNRNTGLNSRGRPQYTTITRQRPQSGGERSREEVKEDVKEEGKDEPEEESSQTTARVTSSRPGQPEYVTIRRSRPSVTTEVTTDLDYVTIRRQQNRQPVDDTTTSKYTTIIRRRPTAEQTQQDEENNEAEKEKINEEKQEEVVEVQTTKPEEQAIETTIKTIEKEILAVSDQLPSTEGVVSTTTRESSTSTTPTEQTEASSTTSRSTTTEKPATPQLFKPRPFVARPRPTKITAQTTTTESTSTTTRKVSLSSPRSTGVVGNRGNSRFKVPTKVRASTYASTLTEYNEEEYVDDVDEEQPNRAYRPTALVDLSSLTSADITFGKVGGRKHVRRRPTTTTTQTPSTTTTEKIILGLRTTSRPTLLVRKNLLASLEASRIPRKLIRPTTSEAPLEKSSPVVIRSFSTTPRTELVQEPPVRQYATIVRAKPVQITEAPETEIPETDNEVTNSPIVEDSTGSDTDNEYKITEPEITTEAPLTTEEHTTEGQLTARTRRVIKRIRPTTSTPLENETGEDNDASSETNRGIVKRIRPIPISGREEIEEIKLSESNISDGTRFGINGVQEDGTNRRRKKIIRKIRPGSFRNDNDQFKNIEEDINRPQILRENLEKLNLNNKFALRRPQILKTNSEDNIDEEENDENSNKNQNDNSKNDENRNKNENDTSKNEFGNLRTRLAFKRPQILGSENQNATEDEENNGNVVRRPQILKIGTEGSKIENSLRNKFILKRPQLLKNINESSDEEEKILRQPENFQNETEETETDDDISNKFSLKRTQLLRKDNENSTKDYVEIVRRPQINKENEDTENDDDSDDESDVKNRFGLKRPQIFGSVNEEDEQKGTKIVFRRPAILRPKNNDEKTEEKIIDEDENIDYEENNEEVSIKQRINIDKLNPDEGDKEPTFRAIRVKQNLEGVPIQEEKPQNRTRKIIRLRLRPTSTGTTVSTTENIDYENDITTFESNYIEEGETTTELLEDTTDVTTEDYTTTEEITTTTTSKPRSTVPSLTGRPRPAYRPRGRTPTTPDFRSTTPTPAAYRRKFTFRTQPTTSTTVKTTITTPTTITTTTSTPTTTETLTTEADIITTEAITEEVITATENKLEELSTVLSAPEEEATTVVEESSTVLPSTEILVEETTIVEPITTEQQEVSTEILEDTTIYDVTTEFTQNIIEIPQNISEYNQNVTETTNISENITESTPVKSTPVYKPIRYKPGERPKLRFNLNRPEIEQSTTEGNKIRKFIPTRPSNQRSRFAINRDNQIRNKTQTNNESSVVETQRPRFNFNKTRNIQPQLNNEGNNKNVPQGRKLEINKYDQDDYDANDDEEIQDELETDTEVESDVPINEVNEQTNLGQKYEESSLRKPNQPAPGRVQARNYTRKFVNKPIYATTPSTTTVAVQEELLNARNKKLFSNPRKMNTPLKPTTEEVVTIPSTDIPITPDIITTTEDIIISTEPQQLSTFHHVFAEREPTESEPTSITTEMEVATSTEGNTVIQEPNKLERLVEVNRIVEVSWEDHLRNTTGESKGQILNPKVARVGAINRLTVINVVDGSDTNNHATLEDILTGRKIFSSSKSNVNYTKTNNETTTVPSDIETKLNILNNTLEIIEADRKFEIFSRSNVVDYSHRKDPIASAITKYGAAPVIDTVAVSDKQNNVDDQDLLESANGRVRIRILGNDPVYSPIISDNQEVVTTKAEVVEVPSKTDEIRIAPIRVAIA